MILYTPSKELLSEVLELDIRESKYKDIDNMLLRYGYWQECISNGKDISGVEYAEINIYELAFRTREYLKTKSKHLSLNQSIDDIFKEANDIYESLNK